MTLYALFGDDMRLWLTTKDADDVFFGISSVAFVLFAFELLINAIARPGFANPPSFFFWLDLLATLSLLPDIGWVWDPIEDLFAGTSTSTDGGSDISAQIRAGRAARAGTRAGRVVRVVRLIRLIRVFKLYKQWTRAREGRRRARARKAEEERRRALEEAQRQHLAAATAQAIARRASDAAQDGNTGGANPKTPTSRRASRKVVPLNTSADNDAAPQEDGSSSGDNKTAARDIVRQSSSLRRAAVLRQHSEQRGTVGTPGEAPRGTAEAQSATAQPTLTPSPVQPVAASEEPSGSTGALVVRRHSGNASIMSADDDYEDELNAQALAAATGLPQYATALDAALEEEVEEEARNPAPREADGSATDARSRKKISNVGIVLSDLTTRRVIVLILVMLIIVPFLSATESTASTQIRGGLAELHRYPQDVNVSVGTFRFSVQEYARHAGKVVYLAVCPSESTGCLHQWPASTLHPWLQELRFDSNGDEPRFPNGTVDPTAGSDVSPSTGWSASLLLSSEAAVLSQYRDVEVQAYTVSTCYGVDEFGRGADDPARGLCDSVVWTDETDASKEEAFWSFIRTWFVIVVITIGAGMFTRDAELLVIRPIERMALLMSKLAADPLAEIQALKKTVLRDAYDSDESDDEDEEEDEDEEPSGKSDRRRVSTEDDQRSGSSSDDDDATAVEGVDGGDGKPTNKAGRASRAAASGAGPDGKPAGSVPHLPLATVNVVTSGRRQRSHSITSGHTGGSTRGGASARQRGARRHSHRSQSSERGHGSKNNNNGPLLSRFASKRLLLADANPVINTATMRKLPKTSSNKLGERGSNGERSSARRLGLSRRRIVARTSGDGQDDGAAVPGAASGEAKPASGKKPFSLSRSASVGGKRSKASPGRKGKRAKPLTVGRCAKKSAAYVCTSLLNLVGGSAEDASKQAQGSYETAQLENAMLKIGGLLQLGFGEAGADIIGQNMGQSHGKLNPLVPGRRIDAIFGFCDIRRFTDATECLQEEVMVFVNTVGQLVHSCTHRLGGAANKNIGDAFLLAWKLPKLLDPSEARVKRRALIHKARGMTAHGRRVSMEAFASMLDRPVSSAAGEAGPVDHMTSLMSPTGFHASSATGIGGRAAASATGEWVAQGEFTSGASRVPFGARHSARAAAASGHGDAAPNDNGFSAPPMQLRPSDTKAVTAATAADVSSSTAQDPGEASPTTASHVVTRTDPTSPQTHTTAQLPAAAAAAAKAAAAESASSSSSSSSSSSAAAATDAMPPGSLRFAGRAASDGLLPQPGSPRLLDRTAAAAGVAAQSEALPGGPGAGQGVHALTSSHGRRRASSPMIQGLARKRMTRPSIVSVMPGKEHQHQAGVTIIQDPTAAHAGQAGGNSSGGMPTGDSRVARAGSLLMRDRTATARVADNALAAFLKVIVDIHNANKRRGALYRFRRHPAIRSAFGKDFRVQLGFGLHLGWAVEGAVGSSYKVDASYLSPHVNLASRLEALTKFYGVPLLLSGNFAQELSLDAQRYLRLIDRVTVKGSRTPIELYTFDITCFPSSLGELAENIEPRTEEERHANKLANEPYIHIDFASDPNILRLQDSLPDAFFVDFHMGVRAYMRGDWDEARRILTQTQARYRPEGDGPTAALLRTMDKLGADYDGDAPPTWKGVHVLDSKSG